MRLPQVIALIFLGLSMFFPQTVFSAPKPSTCYGTTSKGRLENGVKLPESGKNFVVYSSLGHWMGRTHVHSAVSKVVLEAYRKLQQKLPDKIFIYGETGWPEGGSFPPHRTHQNGLSVDFMVPVVNEEGESVPLPTSMFLKFGYNIEFDNKGKYDNLTIDWEALAAHLHFLEMSAQEQGMGIARVIFDPALQPQMFKTRLGADLKQRMKFSTKPSWVRHDEHYHVDFAVPCRKMGK